MRNARPAPVGIAILIERSGLVGAALVVVIRWWTG